MLRDLVVEHGTLQEERIENVISKYIRYEVNPCQILLTQEGDSLPNKLKVLVYLVAVLGCQFVSPNEPIPMTRPSDLERTLGIIGNTLRPVLKDLSDSHLVWVEEGAYLVRYTDLEKVAREIAQHTSKSVHRSEKPRRKPNSRKKKKTAKTEISTKGSPKQNETKNTDRKKRAVSASQALKSLLDEGFFAEYRTLRHVVDRLGEKAISIEITSVSGPIAELVRRDQLERKKSTANGKSAWVYRVPLK